MGFLEQQLKREYKSGHVIFKDGDPGQTMFIILEGKVEITKLLGDQKTVLATLDKGSIFGEMAIIDREPRSATATTLSDTTMLEISREMFHDRLAQVPGWMQSFFAILVDRLRSATRLQSILLTQGAGRQILNLLAVLVQSGDKDATDRVILPINETAGKMAFILGLEEELVSKTIHRFIDTKLCEIARKIDTGRVLVFDNTEKLFQLARFCKERMLIESGLIKTMSEEFRFKNRHEVELLQVLSALVQDPDVPDDMPSSKMDERVKEKYKNPIGFYQPLLDNFVKVGLLEKFQPKDGDPSYAINNKELFQDQLAKISLVKELRGLENKIRR